MKGSAKNVDHFFGHLNWSLFTFESWTTARFLLGRLVERQRNRLHDFLNPNQHGGHHNMNLNHGGPHGDGSSPAAMVQPPAPNEKDKKPRIGFGLGPINIGINLPTLRPHRPKNPKEQPEPTTTSPFVPVSIKMTGQDTITSCPGWSANTRLSTLVCPFASLDLLQRHVF